MRESHLQLLVCNVFVFELLCRVQERLLHVLEVLHLLIESPDVLAVVLALLLQLLHGL